jgi:hypothetical protein
MSPWNAEGLALIADFVSTQAGKTGTMINQTERVYAWETQWSHWNHKAYDSLNQPRRWMRWAMKHYNVPYVTMGIVEPGKKKASFYRMLDHRIMLLPAHMNAASVLHEVAHAITDYYYVEEDHHGPVWAGIFLWLMVRAGFAPKIAFTASMKEAGIKWKDGLSPQVVKKRSIKLPHIQHKKTLTAQRRKGL